MVRTWMIATSRSLQWIVSASFKMERYNLYEDFREKDGPPMNADVAEEIYPYAKGLVYAL